MLHSLLLFAIATVPISFVEARPTRENGTSPNLVRRVRFVDCGLESNSSALLVDQFDIGPMPIKIPGPLPLRIGANILRPVPNNVDVKIVLRKKRKVDDEIDYFLKNRRSEDWVKLPCMSGFGSCKFYDIPTCLITEHVLGCPLEMRRYSINRQLVLTQPSVAFDRLLEGDYRVTLKIRHPVTREILSCLRAQFSLATQK
uniref:MD-2-related lipid-recognition domain-containing protein n=1 Tax=Plectus sambesii TaxID=2011161 RepID=A0A914XMS3_9BILA